MPETLSPAERLALVLDDMFAVPFDEIASIVGRSPDAAKMLASRARRRVRGAGARRGKITGIDVLADPDRLTEIDLVVLKD